MEVLAFVFDIACLLALVYTIREYKKLEKEYDAFIDEYNEFLAKYNTVVKESESLIEENDDLADENNQLRKELERVRVSRNECSRKYLKVLEDKEKLVKFLSQRLKNEN